MRRHRFDALSFLFALLFAVLGLAVLLEVDLRPVSAAWAGPVVLILLGMVLLAGALARSREPEPDGGSERAVGAVASPTDGAAGQPPTEDDPGTRPTDDDPGLRRTDGDPGAPPRDGDAAGDRPGDDDGTPR